MRTYFTTLTVEDWQPVFELYPNCAQIFLECLEYVSNKQLASIYAFVIMKDHVHLILEVNDIPIKILIQKIKKHTGSKIIRLLYDTDKDYLEVNFQTIRKDRKYKFWKIVNGNIEIIGDNMFAQKLRYIHENPTKGNYAVCSSPDEYELSSAKSYSMSKSLYSFLTLY